MEINELVTQLYEAKLAEQAAKEHRVELEARLAERLNIPEGWEGSQTRPMGEFRVKLTRRNNIKIDANRLVELARVNNILPMMEKCFRRKWELNRVEWNRADEKARQILAPAMEMTPGKASFSIDKMEG